MGWLGLISYILLFFVAILSVAKKWDEKNINLFILSYFLINLFVVGFRPQGAGSDTESYLYNYHLIKSGFDLPTVEIGFQYLLRALDVLGVSEDLLWPVLTLVFLFLFFCSINSFEVNQRIFITLGLASSTAFFDLESNGIRQGLATAVGIWAIFGFNGLRRFLLLLLAVLLHSSAAIIFLIIILENISFFQKRWVIKILALVLAASSIGFIFGKNIISIDALNFYGVDFFVADKFLSYTDSGLRGAYDSLTLVGRLVQVVPMLVVVGLVFYLPNSREFRVVCILVIFLFLFYISLASTGYSYRWAYYPQLLVVYLLPWFFSIDKILKKEVIVMRFSMCAVYILWGMYSVWVNGVLLWGK